MFFSVDKRVRFELLYVFIQSISMVYRFQYAIGHPWRYFMSFRIKLYNTCKEAFVVRIYQ